MTEQGKTELTTDEALAAMIDAAEAEIAWLKNGLNVTPHSLVTTVVIAKRALSRHTAPPSVGLVEAAERIRVNYLAMKGNRSGGDGMLWVDMCLGIDDLIAALASAESEQDSISKYAHKRLHELADDGALDCVQCGGDVIATLSCGFEVHCIECLQAEAEQGTVVFWVVKDKPKETGTCTPKIYNQEPTKVHPEHQSNYEYYWSEKNMIQLISDEGLLALGIPAPALGHCIRVTLHNVVKTEGE